MEKPPFTCLVLLCLCAAIPAFSEDGYQIMLKNYNLDEGRDQRADLRMELIKRNGKKRTREVTYWKLERGDEDKSLMYFRKPVSDKGTSFLTWEHKNKDDDQWLYLPALKRVRRISAAEKHKSFMGTDFSYNDMAEPHPDEFIHKLLGEENIDGKDCFKVESIHKTYSGDQAYKNKKRYQYSKTLSWICKDNYILLKAKMFDKKGRECKDFHARDIKKIDGIWTAMILEMIKLKTGHRTILTITDIKYNIGLKDTFFRQRELKKPR